MALFDLSYPRQRCCFGRETLLALPASGAASHEFLLAQNHQGFAKRANTSPGQRLFLKNMLHDAQQRGNVPRLGKADLFDMVGVLKNKTKNQRSPKEGAPHATLPPTPLTWTPASSSVELKV
jgi:hypothetical protein